MGAVKLIEEEISHCLEHLNNHQKEVVLSVVKTMARDEDDWWEQVETAAEDSIKRGMQQAKEGKTTPQAEVMKKYDKIAIEIIWSEEAKDTFDENIHYLQKEWTGKNQ